jgi:hypothetical protein
MKLGMVSRHGTYVMVKKLSNLGQAILQASYKPELLATLVVPVGKHAPLVGETIISPSSSLVFYCTRNMEQREIRAEL